MAKLTQTRLHELFDFDADAGALIWKSRPEVIGAYLEARSAA